MSGMFDNYENLSEEYAPNNLKPRPPFPPKNPCSPLEPCRANKPFEDYNTQGELIGYWWYYGNTLNLEFNIEQEVIVDGSCNYVTAEDFMKSIKPTTTIKLYNFRRECIHTLVIPDVEITTVVFPIGQELSEKLVKGVYYCSLTLSNEEKDYNETILKLDDCTLTVK